MKDILKIVKYFEDSGIILKGVRGTIKYVLSNKKEDFLVHCLVHSVQAC